jgi:protoporphyrinogen oxidase
VAGPAEVVIIGGGPAGLTAAYELVKHGRSVTVLEKDPTYVGGIARTVQYKGFRFDIGGHRFFSKSDEIERLWDELCAEDLLRRPRLSRIYYRGTFFDYPLKAGNALRGLGVFESMACVASYLRYRARPIRPELSFEDWVVNRFGRRLFEIFFRTYTEKVWGMPCNQISADWASQRIKGLSLKEAVLNALLPQRNRSRDRTIKTLIDSFRYPRLGPGMMWETTRDRVAALGGEVKMGHTVTAIRHDGRRVTGVVIRTGSGNTETLPAEHVISSMPLRELIEQWDPAPPQAVLDAARSLKYRDFLTVALIVRRPQLFPDNWIYIHDPSVKVGRIQNFRAWSPEMVPDPELACLGLEYFCFEGDSLWTTSDSELIALATREIDRIGLIRADEVIDGCVVRMEKTYPVYDGAYARHVEVIRDYLGQFTNLQVVGRNGMHKYNNQDHSMMTALLAARNIMGAQFDVWKVNTDAEYLEEDRGAPDQGRLVPVGRQDAVPTATGSDGD